MRRREFITLLGGAVSTWPLAARAQQTEQVRRIGVLMNVRAEHPEGQPVITAFQQSLQQLGCAATVRLSTFANSGHSAFKISAAIATRADESDSSSVENERSFPAALSIV